MEKFSFVYIISFFFVTLLGVLALSYTGERQDLSNYIEVTIHEGESIWNIAEQYESVYGLDKIEFIKWVEENNDLTNLTLKPGDTVVIPIEKKMLYNNHLLAKEK
ncbi:cell division suppressor protein YneA [Aeribacillus alveayuensis]|uniref:2-hydroxy-3-keto-5-methylthiopentenyl-1-phosphate phosphatase n=1 Tax=Aeribacillus alveayuensis TaxID=279215 RepID=A0ABT9VLJ4_9BACI|nr:2-hydroxy-3-keto-5-methylthiopentenyl-1-phosphate phosphatase [Bacillus alveayuensis]